MAVRGAEGSENRPEFTLRQEEDSQEIFDRGSSGQEIILEGDLRRRGLSAAIVFNARASADKILT